MLDIKKHIPHIFGTLVFAIVVQIALLPTKGYWPQDAFAWIFIVVWPLVFFAVYGWFISLQIKSAKENTIRSSFIGKVTAVAIPLVILFVIIASKIEIWLKPHFMVSNASNISPQQTSGSHTTTADFNR